MYVNLYPNKELKKTKRTLLLGGMFMFCGGIYALLRELSAYEQLRWEWIALAGMVSVGGGWAIAMGAGKLQFKDAYFSMTPERISYRLNFYRAERTIYWNNLDAILASERTLVFELKDGKQVVMRLGNVQCSKIANHVSVSIQLAAIQQQVEVNQVVSRAQKVI